MRFSSSNLPPSEWITTDEGVAQLCEYLTNSTCIYGFDTETDGLGYRTVDDVGKINFAGDGIGAALLVVCLAFESRRIAIPTYGRYARFIAPLAEMLRVTAPRAAGYNWIFDANVVESNVRDKGYELTSHYADGLKLWNLFDEDAENTGRERGLKPRAAFWLNLPMRTFKDFDVGIHTKLEDASSHAFALDYCTRDAWAHLGMAKLGASTADRLPWCKECEHCGQEAMQYDPIKDLWYCQDHGWVKGGKELTMWDWHQRLDVPLNVILKRMEQRGMRIDMTPLRRAAEPLNQYLSQLYSRFQSEVASGLIAAGGVPREINIGSDEELRTLYFGGKDPDGHVIGLSLAAKRKTKTGGVGLDKKQLASMRTDPKAVGVPTLEQYRSIRKVITTYVEGMGNLVYPVTGCLHTTLRPIAVTGRLTSQKPNLMNLPSKPLKVEIPAANPLLNSYSIQEIAESWGEPIEDVKIELSKPEYHPTAHVVDLREAAIARDGFILTCADYAQLEIRITAAISMDKNLIDVINDGRDMHCYTAYEAYRNNMPGMSYEQMYETQRTKDREYSTRLSWLPQVLQKDFSEIRDLKLADTIFRPGEVAYENHQKRLASLSDVSDHLLSSMSDDDLDRVFTSEAEDWATSMASGPHKESIAKVLTLLGPFDDRNKKLRAAAKACIFGTIYGIGPQGLAEQISAAIGDVYLVQDAKQLIKMILDDLYPGVGVMMKRAAKTVRDYGYTRTLGGRYRHPYGSWSGDRGQVARAVRQSGNSPVQGTAMDMMQRVMIQLEKDEEMKQYGSRMIMQIHDELVSEVPIAYGKQALARKLYIMENMHGFDTPVRMAATGSVANSWGQAK